MWPPTRVAIGEYLRMPSSGTVPLFATGLHFFFTFSFSCETTEILDLTSSTNQTAMFKCFAHAAANPNQGGGTLRQFTELKLHQLGAKNSIVKCWLSRQRCM